MQHCRRIVLLSLTLLVGVLSFISINEGLPPDAAPNPEYSALDAPRLEMSLRRGQLAIRGHTASSSQERSLLQSADLFFSGARKSAQFSPLGTAPDYWAQTSIVLLESLSATLSAQALLTDKALRIRGVSTDAWHEALPRLRAALPQGIPLDVEMIIADDSVSARDLCARALARQRSGAINFEESTTALRSSAKLALDRVASLADACRQSTLTITGHTDSSGPDTWNRELSLARANAVAAYLADSGIASERLRTIGAGSSQSVTSNDSRYGRSLNRRITIDFQPEL